MSIVGHIASLWRYPVKSMCGEELPELFAGMGGIKGDRLFAFRSSIARADFPYFTARQQHEMLRYRPRFTQGGQSDSPNEWKVEVETPSGKMFTIDDPELMETLRAGADPNHQLSLMRSDRALTDCYPISIFSLQTTRELGDEIGIPIDPRRFRANLYLDLAGSEGFAEDAFVGRSLCIGSTAVISIVKRDARCVMINLDPETAVSEPAVLKKVGQAHAACAGVYGTVVTEGRVRIGDPVALLD